LPLLVLLLAAEVCVRLAGLGSPSYLTAGMPEDLAGLLEWDRELFWRVRPNLDKTFQGVRVVTNRHGHRSPELGPKTGNTFRILCLGESTTFGVGVENEATYAAGLERALAARDPGRSYQVINAGVSAYSTFQSFKYLELRGAELQPDLVLFYHEFNDYMPTSFREKNTTELDVSRSDRQRYDSLGDRFARRLLAHSALYRTLNYLAAERHLRHLQERPLAVSWQEIGIPDHVFSMRRSLRHAGDGPPAQASINERALPTRLSPLERERTLRDLIALCRQRGIGLVVMHPSYQLSRQHECVLTVVCREERVPLFEAYDSLHLPNTEASRFFRDVLHPNRDGHAALARDLLRFLAEAQLLPALSHGGV
jgi:lysophospholipase L1-like esterase